MNNTIEIGDIVSFECNGKTYTAKVKDILPWREVGRGVKVGPTIIFEDNKVFGDNGAVSRNMSECTLYSKAEKIKLNIKLPNKS